MKPENHATVEYNVMQAIYRYNRLQTGLQKMMTLWLWH